MTPIAPAPWIQQQHDSEISERLERDYPMRTNRIVCVGFYRTFRVERRENRARVDTGKPVY